jgi:hypothetical protein
MEISSLGTNWKKINDVHHLQATLGLFFFSKELLPQVLTFEQ